MKLISLINLDMYDTVYTLKIEGFVFLCVPEFNCCPKAAKY